MLVQSIFRFFAAAAWMLVCAPWTTTAATGTCRPLAAQTHLMDTGHGPQLSFFEKTALKTAARRLLKSWRKQAWAAEMRSDSAAPCGRIMLLSGQEIDAELTDITPTEVKYRPCGQPDYPKFVLSKKQVLLVVGADGVKQYENPNQVTQNAEKTNATAAVNHKGALAAAAFGIATLMSIFFLELFGLALLLGLIAAVLSLVSGKAIKKHPKKYKGKNLATAGLILGALAVLVSLLALANR